MYQRARSAEAKQRRAEDLLDAARAIAADHGGVRHVTLAGVTEVASLHPSAVRRYFASKEELLLELAERGWNQWRDVLVDLLRGAPERTPAQIASTMSSSLASLPLFCDLLTHVPLSLEGDVDIDRARKYKRNSFAAYDAIVEAITANSRLTTSQAEALITAALAMAAHLWQISHPTETLAALYAQEPRWAHAALDFEPRLSRLLQATAAGLMKEPERAIDAV
ncbi:TetR family transcriptional regulator [Paractinoplanes toevensis]|nr:TetR family transcriptional regulator [Actinoplanes toevensis]